MSASQSGVFNFHEFSDAGAPLVLGRLYTYATGTTTFKAAYTDAAGTIPHSYTSDGLGGLYIALNSRGELPAPLYLLTDSSYDLALKRADGSTVWTRRADGVAAASGGVFTQAGTGAVTRITQDKMREVELTPEDFGAVGDGVANDLAPLKLAYAAAVLLGVALVLKKNYRIVMTAATDPIQLSAGTHIIFRGGKITMTTFGLPVFWNQGGVGKFLIENPYFVYSGTATAALPAFTQTFFDNLVRGAFGFAPRDVTGMMCFYGTRGVEIRGTAKFEASDTSDVSKLFPRCIVVGNSNTDQRAVVRIDDIVLDGVLFGLLAWGYDLMRVRDVYSDHWGQLPLATYTWDAQGHAVYCTPTTVGGTTMTGDLFDLGTVVSGSDTTAGSPSFKFTVQSSRLKIKSIYSERSAGALDFDGTNYDIGPVFAKSSAAADFAASKMIRVGAGNAAVDGPAQFGPVYLQVPSDSTGNVATVFGNMVNFHDWTITYDGTALALPLILGEMNDCTWDLTLRLSQTQAAGNPTAFRVDAGGDRNRFDIRVYSPQASGLRIVENDKPGSVDNTARILDVQTGSERNLALGGEWGMKTAVQTLTGVSGATVTATALVPKGAVLLGVTSYILTTLGASGGTTGYQIGTGASATRFGVRVGVSAGGGTNNSDWTSGTIDLQTADLNVILTATGGNFNGTGDIIVRAQYFTASRNGDIS